MVSTLKNFKTFDQMFGRYQTAEFNDKNTFDLKAQYNKYPLMGILCEKGDC